MRTCEGCIHLVEASGVGELKVCLYPVPFWLERFAPQLVNFKDHPDCERYEGKYDNCDV